MATVVVVQSGELTAWVGAVSGLAGVALGAGIDWWRTRRAERRRLRQDLIRAGQDFAYGAEALEGVLSAIRGAHSEKLDENLRPVWIEMLHARTEDTRAAASVVGLHGSPELADALHRVGHAAARPYEHDDPAANQRREQELNKALAAYYTVVKKLKL